MEEEYICKIATLEEMNIKWDEEINLHSDKENWTYWKTQNIDNFKKGYSIPYYGLLNDKIICEATAIVNSKVTQNPLMLIDKETVYLLGFRTKKEYQNKGYFSKLMKYLLEDLRKKGYKKVTLGVEKCEKTNKEIYEYWGFDTYVKSGKETYPNGEVIEVNYYLKQL